VIALQASAADAIADLAARGLAFAVLSESMAARYRDRLAGFVPQPVSPAHYASLRRTTTNVTAMSAAASRT
jgi:DNA-binding transcriptional LysR family regulator